MAQWAPCGFFLGWVLHTLLLSIQIYCHLEGLPLSHLPLGSLPWFFPDKPGSLHDFRILKEALLLACEVLLPNPLLNLIDWRFFTGNLWLFPHNIQLFVQPLSTKISIDRRIFLVLLFRTFGAVFERKLWVVWVFWVHLLKDILWVRAVHCLNVLLSLALSQDRVIQLAIGFSVDTRLQKGIDKLAHILNVLRVDCRPRVTLLRFIQLVWVELFLGLFVQHDHNIVHTHLGIVDQQAVVLIEIQEPSLVQSIKLSLQSFIRQRTLLQEIRNFVWTLNHNQFE